MSTSHVFNNATADIKVVTIRASRPGDEQNVVDFYNSFPHQFVDQRPPAVWEDQTRKGRAILFVEKDTGKVLVSSINYDTTPDNRDKNALPEWIEIGSTRSAANGYFISPILVSIQMMDSFFNRPPRKFFFADMYNDNQSAIGLLKNIIGWSYFKPVDGLVDAAGLREDLPKLSWLRGTARDLPRMARLVLHTIDNPDISRSKGGTTMRLDLSELPWVTTHRAVLEQLASGPLANALENGAAGLSVAQAKALHTKMYTPAANKPKPAL